MGTPRKSEFSPEVRTSETGSTLYIESNDCDCKGSEEGSIPLILTSFSWSAELVWSRGRSGEFGGELPIIEASEPPGGSAMRVHDT